MYAIRWLAGERHVSTFGVEKSTTKDFTSSRWRHLSHWQCHDFFAIAASLNGGPHNTGFCMANTMSATIAAYNLSTGLFDYRYVVCKQAPSGDFFTKRERRYGPIFKTHFVGRPTVYVAGPEAIKIVMLGEHSLVETAWPPAMRHLLGRGALSSLNGDEHRYRRRCTMGYLGRSDCSFRYASVLRQIIRDELNRYRYRCHLGVAMY